MDIIELSPLIEDIDENAKEIYRVSNQICSINNKVNRFGSIWLCEINDEILMLNVRKVINQWTRHTSVGVKKNPKLQKSFQSFYKHLYEFLLLMNDIEESGYHDLAKASLYQGKLFRYIGSGSSFNRADKRIEPEYNDIYVSWSKKRKNTYFEQKLYGIITLLTCNVESPNYGIDLTPFGVACDGEDEVVFPTIKDTLEEIEYIDRESRKSEKIKVIK